LDSPGKYNAYLGDNYAHPTSPRRDPPVRPSLAPSTLSRRPAGQPQPSSTLSPDGNGNRTRSPPSPAPARRVPDADESTLRGTSTFLDYDFPMPPSSVTLPHTSGRRPDAFLQARNGNLNGSHSQSPMKSSVNRI